MLVAITVTLAALAVLAAIVVVAVGGGGELSTEHPDHPPLALPGRHAVGGTDAALLRLPLGLWGYHKQITDEALERFAYELTERDTRIAVLEQELAEARQGSGGDTRDRHRALPSARNDMPIMGEDPLATRADRPWAAPATGGDPLATRTDQPSEAPVTREEPLIPQAPRVGGAEEAESTGSTDGLDEPGSGYVYTPPTDPWKMLAERHDDEAEDEVDDVEDRHPARKDDGE